MKSSNENVRLLRPLLRGIPLIALAIACALIAASFYLKYATPMYESTAKIRLADTKDGSASTNLFKDLDVFVSANKIGAEVEVLKSSVIMNKTLDSLPFDVTTYRVGKMRRQELYREAPFAVVYQLSNEALYDRVFKLDIPDGVHFNLQLPGHKDFVHGRLGEGVNIPDGKLLIARNDTLLAQRSDLTLPDKYEFVINSRRKLVDASLAALDITSIDKEIPILRLNFKSPVAQKAADFVNEMSKTYVEDYVQTKCAAANITVNFLNNQLQQVGGRLDASENAIEQYRNEKNIINLRQETETDLRKIADMKVQQTNVRMSLEATQNLEKYMVVGRDNTVELAPNFEAYTDLLATELVKKMKNLQAEKKDLLTKYTPDYEEVKLVDAKLKDISNYLEEGIRNTRKSLQTKYDRLSHDINVAEGAFDGLPTKEKTMGILNRTHALNEETYNFLNTKRNEAEIARAASISFHRVISPGEVPAAPITPNRTLIKVLAVFLAFLGSVLLIYVVHAVKGKVNSVANIERASSAPVAATTPMLLKPEAIQRHFHKLAIKLEIKGMLSPASVLAVSSFSENEGKSYNALHTALELVRQQKKVLLLDTDGKLEMADMLPGVLGLEYHNMARTPQLFSNSDVLQKQLTAWKTAYDIIIIRNEPVTEASNGLMLMKLADANLFLFDSRRTRARMVTEAELLQSEYHFNNFQYLLNREGYNPNVLQPLWAGILRLLRKNQSVRA